MGKGKWITGQKVSAEKLARAKELRRNMTPAERRLWQQLRANRLAGWHFRRQQILAGLIVDFYCHKAGLVIEIDGPIHERHEIEDQERTRILTEMGLRVVRFDNQEVMNHMERVLEAILEALESGADNGVEV